jgi:Protein of unknown function (DUF1460)
MLSRRRFLFAAASCGLPALAGEHLPQSVTFVGRKKFEAIRGLAHTRIWRALPIGERVIACALRLQGTPYVGFTLEIDDHIESPSVNFDGLDCWTFFETALCLARLFRNSLIYPYENAQPSDLLREIEWTRYRGGKCNGNYLDRIHYLEEWFRDNDRRGNVKDITKSLASTVPLEGRKIDEMTVLWKSYRYLKNNPSLRTGMTAMEAELQTHPFRYIPKAAVAGIEPKIQSGDIIGIVTHKPHVYCSHVGLALRTQDGVCHFMHASATKKRVIIDASISDYLHSIKSHAGIVVARPL